MKSISSPTYSAITRDKQFQVYLCTEIYQYTSILKTKREKQINKNEERIIPFKFSLCFVLFSEYQSQRFYGVFTIVYYAISSFNSCIIFPFYR